MRGQKPRKRDTLVETGVKDILAAKELEKKLLSGTLLDKSPSNIAAVAAARAATHRLSNGAPLLTQSEAPHVSLFDVATAYLQDNNLQAVEDIADLPVQRDFLSAVGEVSNSLRVSREMYLSAPAMIAQKQAQLREAVEKAMRKIPVGELESNIEHFSFADYQEYLRSIGSLDDEPNFHVFAEGNLQPILAVLRDEAIGLNRGYRKVARNINGFQFVEDVYDGEFGDAGDDFEVVHRITTRSKETQTELRVNDKSFLAEITRLSDEIVNLRGIIKGQQQRLNHYDMFRETVIKRIAGLMEETRSTQRAKEEELGRVITLLVHAVHQNEDFANKLNILATQHNAADAAAAAGATGAVSVISDLDLVRERKKIAQTFSNAITRTKRQRFILEERLEAMERQGLEQNESWAKQLLIVQTNLNLLHRGFLEGRVKEAVDMCEDSIEEQATGGFGGMDAVKVLDALDQYLPAEQRRTCAALVETAFQRIDEITVFSARTAVDLVRHGHKQLVLAEGISKAATCIGRSREVISDVLRGVVKCVGTELFSAAVRLDEQKRKQDIEHEQQIAALRKEQEVDHRAAALHKSLRRAKEQHQPLSMDFGAQVSENVIANAIAQALTSSPTTADIKKGKKGKATKAMSESVLERTFGTMEASVMSPNADPMSPINIDGVSSPRATQAPPPVLPAKPSLTIEAARLDAKTTKEVLGSGMVFLEELSSEVRTYAAHFGSSVPTRIGEINYLISVMKQLSLRAQAAEVAPTSNAEEDPSSTTTAGHKATERRGSVAGKSPKVRRSSIAAASTTPQRVKGSKAESPQRKKKGRPSGDKHTPPQTPTHGKNSSTAVASPEATPTRTTVSGTKDASPASSHPRETVPAIKDSRSTLDKPTTESSTKKTTQPTRPRVDVAELREDGYKASTRISSPTAALSDSKEKMTSFTSSTSDAIIPAQPPSKNHAVIEALLAKANLANVDLTRLSSAEILDKLASVPSTPDREGGEACFTPVNRRQRIVEAKAQKEQAAKEAAIREVADAAIARAEAEAAAAKDHAAHLAAELAAAVASMAALKAAQSEALFARERLASPAGTLPSSGDTAREVLDARHVSQRIAAEREARQAAGAAQIGVQTRALMGVPRTPAMDTGMPRLEPVAVTGVGSNATVWAHQAAVTSNEGSLLPKLHHRNLGGGNHARSRQHGTPSVAVATTPTANERSRAGSISPFTVDRLVGRTTPPPTEMPRTPLELRTRRYEVGTPSAAVVFAKLDPTPHARTPGPAL